MKITLTSVVALAVSLVGVSATVDFSQYPWIAPKSTDLRSPCPGLNTYVLCSSLDILLIKYLALLITVSCLEMAEV